MMILFWVLAAICNAVMDTLTHHFEHSVFVNKKAAFWNPAISWKTGYIKYTKYKADAWHLFKSAMIIFICLAFVDALILGVTIGFQAWYFYAIAFIALGIIWNGVFSIFYNHILLT